MSKFKEFAATLAAIILIIVMFCGSATAASIFVTAVAPDMLARLPPRVPSPSSFSNSTSGSSG